MDELARDARDDWRRSPGWRGEIDELGSQPLAAGGERLRSDFGDDASIRTDRVLQALLEILEVSVEAGRIQNLGESRQSTSAVCRATIPPAKSRTRTSRNPAAPIFSASSTGPGKRRTLAGRDGYADPPGSSLPSKGTTPSNHRR